MAKRYQPPKEFGRTSKKPKLDVSINQRSSGLGSSRAPTNNNNYNYLWDDDDVDVISLASQIDEMEMKKAKAAAQAIEASEFNITDRDMTFSEFAPKLDSGSSTSTQCPVLKYTVGTRKGAVTEQKSIAQMFEDDDDDFDLLIATAAQAENIYSQQAQQPKASEQKEQPKAAALNQQPVEPDVPPISEDIFKLPSCSNAYTKKPSVAPKQSADCQATSAADSDFKRRQLASERQIQCLMDRIEALKQEKDKLAKDLMTSKSKIEVKNGESSLLRDELRHTKQQLQELKRKNICNVEQTEKECQMKIAKLAKEVEAKETQLQLKTVEYSVLKIRQADESRRLEMSMRNESMALSPETEAPTTVAKHKAQEQNEKKIRNLAIWLMPNLQIDSIQGERILPTDLVEVPEEFYKPELSRVGIMKQLSVFQVEQNNLQKLESRLRLKNYDVVAISAEVITSSQRIFEEFWSHVTKLAYPNYTEILEPLKYDLLQNDDEAQHGARRLHEVMPMYPGERCVHLRRAIAALSLICLRSTAVTTALLNAKDSENNPILFRLTNSISTMAYARDFPRYFGVIEAFAILVRVIIIQLKGQRDSSEWDSNDVEPELKIVVELLKQIVFTRPTPWILKQLSFGMLDLVLRFPEALDLFCVNSPEQSFIVDRIKSVCRFYNNTCLLQVYCGLLESAFPLYLPLSETLFKLLCVLCLNQLRFVFEVFVSPPDFVRTRLPPDSDDEDDDGEVGEDMTNGDSAMSTTAQEKDLKENRGEERPSTSKACRKQRKENISGSSSTSTELSNETNSSALGDTGSDTTNARTSSEESTCCCYLQMCLGILPMTYKVLREWRRSNCEWETPTVGQICRLAVQLIDTIFINFYQTRLFYDDEDTTRHFLYMITHWCAEHAEELSFTEVNKACLKDLLESHVIPKDFSDEDLKQENIAADLQQYCKETGETIAFENGSALEAAIQRLGLAESIFDVEKLLKLDDQQEFNNNKIFDEMLQVLQSKSDT